MSRSRPRSGDRTPGSSQRGQLVGDLDGLGVIQRPHDLGVAQFDGGASVSVPGEGHIAPLPTEPDLLSSMISEFWATPAEYIETRPTATDAH
jgi:hypothetical protein